MNKVWGIYLFIIAALIGLELSLGILLAPVVFNTVPIIGEGVLSHFQSGQLMTAVFIKYNNILIIISIIILVFEMVNFNNNRSEKFNTRFSTLMIALINLSLAVLFILYFTDYIVEAQKAGIEATRTQEFAKIHGASEWCLKIMIIVQTILFFMKFSLQPIKK